MLKKSMAAVAQCSSPGMSESQSLSPVKLKMMASPAWVQEGSRRVGESEEREGSLVSAVSGSGSRPGYGWSL